MMEPNQVAYLIVVIRGVLLFIVFMLAFYLCKPSRVTESELRNHIFFIKILNIFTKIFLQIMGKQLKKCSNLHHSSMFHKNQ